MITSVHNACPDSGQRTLATPELLALILIHLDHRTLLTRVQRVCKTWKNVIHASPDLRRHLFSCIPDTEPRRLPEEKVLNPLLAEIFPPWFDKLAGDDENRSRGPRSRARECAKQLAQSKLYTSRGEDNPFLRKGASWLHMHVSDPPTRSVALYRTRFVKPMREKSFAHAVYYPDGLRMLQLFLLTLPETTDPRDMLQNFQVLWAPPCGGGAISKEQAAAACSSGMTFPPQVRGSSEECSRKIGGMGAELLVQKTLAFFALQGFEGESLLKDLYVRKVTEAYEECGLRYFAQEFAVEMKPYQHDQLMLADTISSYGTVV